MRRGSLVVWLGMLSVGILGSETICNFEMNVLPDDPILPIRMTKIGDGYGDVEAGDEGPPKYAGLQGDGTARFVDTGFHGDDGYILNEVGSSFTFDMRVKSNIAEVIGASEGRRSMGIHDGNNGRGIRLEYGGLKFISGAGVVATANVDLSVFHKVRVCVVDLVDNITGQPPADGLGEAYVYDLENDLDPDPQAVQWSLLAGPIALGSTGASSMIADGTGGIHLNSLSDGITRQSDFTLDWFRVRAPALGATDPIITQSEPVDCFAGISPVSLLQTSALLGQPADPDQFTYTITNLGLNNIQYKVEEVDALAVPFNYGWLTTDKAQGVFHGPLLPDASDTVIAGINTSGLTGGTYVAYLKYTNDYCGGTPPPCLLENFTYADGALNGQGMWIGTATSQIAIDQNTVKITGGSGTCDAARSPFCGGENSLITVSVKVRAGAGTAQMWRLDLEDATGKNLGRWYGSGISIRGGIEDYTGEDLVTADRALSGGGAWDELKTIIHPASNKTAFYFNDALITRDGEGEPWEDTDGILDFGITGAIGRMVTLRYERLDSPEAGSEYLHFDELTVQVSPEYMRRLELEIIECAFEVAPEQGISIGPCGAGLSTEHSLAVKNTGVYTIDGYTVEEVDSNGDPYDYPWLSLTYSGDPIPNGEEDNVVVTVDWDTVSPLGESAFLRFRCTCDNWASYLEHTMEAVKVYGDQPLIIEYHGNVEPDNLNSAGTGYSFMIHEGVRQGGVISDSEAIDGLAYRILDHDDQKTKWHSTPTPEIPSAVGATIVGRIKTYASQAPYGSNLMIYEYSGISAGMMWGGAGGQILETFRNQQTNVIGDDAYHIFRITSQNTRTGAERVVRIFMDEHPVPVMQITNASLMPGPLDAFGFGTGSTLGTQEIYFDWITGTSSGAFAPGEEGSCLGRSLVLTICHDPFADTDGDQDVDQDDFARFQSCFTGPGGGIPPACECFNRPEAGYPFGDGDIDIEDFNAFQACASGPGISANPACDD